MKSTFYAPFHVGSSSNVVDIFSNGYTPEFDLDIKAFSEFIVSNTSLLNAFPYLASCSHNSRGVDPPVLQLPVTALTATTTAVIKETGPYPTDAPAPGKTVRPHFLAQTTTLPQGSLDQGSPNTAKKPIPQQGAPPAQYSPSRQGSDGNPPEASSQASFPFGGTSYKADTSARFVIAEQTLAPAGPAVTISDTPISLAANATAAVTGASTVPIIHDPATGMPTVAPVFTFAGSSYTAGASYAFLIAGQTFTPNGIITISSTPISYAAAGTAVMLGTSTDVLSYATIDPLAAPVITFDGSTYIAATFQDSIIAAQTLMPGGTLSGWGTPLSYTTAGLDVVVGSRTEAVGNGGPSMSGFGGGARSTGGVIGFTGGAAEGRKWSGMGLGIAFGSSLLIAI
ncbi:MAG: hypothetical protein ASARMPREDX12_003460 [Alectoria sarmentosa]|nr:MAG: hypothetical protein ASARMPREDX12_003460 [Alectoria sarmentosa]